MGESANKLLEKIEVTKLPSLPQILVELLDICRSGDFAFEELVDILDKDTALSAKIIAVANSPAFYSTRKLTSLDRALVLLGIDIVKTIVITSSVQQFFSRLSSEGTAYLKQFWRHSLTTAILSREFSKLTGYASPDEAYLAGLLHDVGQLIIWRNFAVEYTALWRMLIHESALVAEEQKRFGMGHQEVGAWLLRNWNLHSLMADAVLFHHEPEDNIRDAHHLVKLVYVANQLGSVPAADIPPDMAVAERILGLSTDLVGEKLADADRQVNRVAQSLGIDISGTPGIADGQLPLTDQNAQQRLSREVRNVALLQGVAQQLSHLRLHTDPLSAIRQCVQILFDIRTVMFFLLDHDGEYLRGISLSEADAVLAEIRIPTRDSRSMLTQALADNVVQHSFEKEQTPITSVVDRQIIALAQTPGMLCLPLTARSEPVGVLVLGVNEMEFHRLRSQVDLFTLFAAEAAETIAANRELRHTAGEIERRDRAAYEAKAREIVHEANNPLSIIQNYLHMLGDKLDEGHPARSDIGVISEEIERVGAILRKLYEIPGAQEEGSDVVDVNALVTEVAKYLEISLLQPRAINVETDLDAALPHIVTNRNALKQILTNLIKNAAEALDAGGRISLATRDAINFDGRQYIEISVVDNGPGLPEPIRANLFNPVTTTKGTGHAGLGLAIVRNLVNELNGFISCRTGERTGTRFQILLPRIIRD